MSQIFINVDPEDVPIVNITVDENSAQSAIDAAAVAQAISEELQNSSYGGKLDKGGYIGTAKNLDDRINDLAFPDEIITRGPVLLENGSVSVSANDFTVRINQNIVTNPIDYNVVINPAALGFNRTDIIIIDQNGSFSKIQGQESADVAVKPVPSADTLEITSINIIGNSILSPIPSDNSKLNRDGYTGTAMTLYQQITSLDEDLNTRIDDVAYEIQEVQLPLKADKLTTYTKTEVDEKLTEETFSITTKIFKNVNLNTYGNIITPSGNQGSTVGLGMDVVYDTKRNLYVLFYSSWNGTGQDESTGAQDIWAATSIDLKTWTKISDTTPILPRGNLGSFDYAGGTFPQLYYETETLTWHMYYIAFDTLGFEKGVSKIAHATATDLLGTWTKTGVIFQSPSGWLLSGHQIYRPCVVKNNGIYYMFFNGGFYGDERFGYATSETLGGVFTASSQPIISAGIKAAPWCSDDFFSDPQVFFEDGKWYCSFWARTSVGTKIGLLWTTEEDFPLNWRAYENYIELGPGNQQRPVFLKKEGFTYLIYNTGILGNLKINLASSIPINTATATDVLVPQYLQVYGNNLLETWAYYSKMTGTGISILAGADSRFYLSDFPGVTNWNQLSIRLTAGFRGRDYTGTYYLVFNDLTTMKTFPLAVSYTEVFDTLVFPNSTSASAKLQFKANSSNSAGEVWLLFYQIKVFKP